MDSELIVPPELIKPKIVQDTIRLPNEKSEFIHIQADPIKLAESFGEFASNFGLDGERAKTIFANKVDFQFGEVGKLNVPGVGRFDHALEDVIGRLKTRNPGGVVIPNNDRYTFCLDAQAIARSLPNIKTPGFGITDYADMTIEQKVMSFEQAVKSFTEHEFFHLIQYIRHPQEPIKAAKQVMQSMRLLFAYATTSLGASAVIRHDIDPPVMIAAPIIIGTIVYLNRGNYKIENDAYDAQKKALKLNLRNPYTFVYEKG